MAITNPNLISGSTIGIEASASLTAGSPYVTWAIPPRVGVISVCVRLDAETGYAYKIEYTNSPVAEVQADTCKWFDYFGANQSTSRIVPMYGCTSAIRVTRVSGGAVALYTAIRGQ